MRKTNDREQEYRNCKVPYLNFNTRTHPANLHVFSMDNSVGGCRGRDNPGGGGRGGVTAWVKLPRGNWPGTNTTTNTP